MAVPTDKTVLETAIKLNYVKLHKELLSIPSDLTQVKSMNGHAKDTLMSIENLISYLIGWGELVLKWIDKKDRNEPVDFPETGFKWNELGKLAQKFYKDYEDMNYDLLCNKLAVTVNRVLEIINSKSNYELYQVNWYEKWTLGRMIQFNTASPYTNARGRIRKWKKENGLV